MRTLSLILASLLCFSNPVSALEDGKFVNRLFPPFGAYLKAGNSFYRVKFADKVRGLGSYGEATGKGLYANGFVNHGFLGKFSGFDGRIFTLTAKSLVKAAAKGNANAIEGTDQPSITAGGKLSVSKNEEFSAIITSVADIEALRVKLNAFYKAGVAGRKGQFHNPKFRVIDAVVYATTYKIDTIIDISADGKASSEVKLNLKVELSGSVKNEKDFQLSGTQIVGYSYRRLCWENGVIVKLGEDEPGRSNDNCKAHGEK